MSSVQALTQAIQDLERITKTLRNECEKLQVTQLPPSLVAVDDADEVIVVDDLVEDEEVIVVDQVKQVRSQRSRSSDFMLILSQLQGQKVYVETYGDRWIGTLSRAGIHYEGRYYGTPTGFCRAHARRITADHLRPTKSGSGWVFVKMLEGPFKDLCLNEVAKQLCDSSRMDMVGGGGVSAGNEIPVVTAPNEVIPLVTTAHESIPFVCVAQKNGMHRGTFQIPTSADVAERGGRWENGRFKFNLGKPDAFSPSGACITVLKRAEGSKTNCWQGTTHVLLYVGGSWKPYREAVKNTD